MSDKLIYRFTPYGKEYSYGDGYWFSNETDEAGNIIEMDPNVASNATFSWSDQFGLNNKNSSNFLANMGSGLANLGSGLFSNLFSSNNGGSSLGMGLLNLGANLYMGNKQLKAAKATQDFNKQQAIAAYNSNVLQNAITQARRTAAEESITGKPAAGNSYFTDWYGNRVTGNQGD